MIPFIWTSVKLIIYVFVDIDSQYKQSNVLDSKKEEILKFFNAEKI